MLNSSFKVPSEPANGKARTLSPREEQISCCLIARGDQASRSITFESRKMHAKGQASLTKRIFCRHKLRSFFWAVRHDCRPMHYELDRFGGAGLPNLARTAAQTFGALVTNA